MKAESLLIPDRILIQEEMMLLQQENPYATIQMNVLNHQGNNKDRKAPVRHNKENPLREVIQEAVDLIQEVHPHQGVAAHHMIVVEVRDHLAVHLVLPVVAQEVVDLHPVEAHDQVVVDKNRENKQ